MQKRSATILKHYDMSSYKSDILVKALINYLSGLVTKLDDIDRCKNQSAVSDALRIDYSILTEDNTNKVFITEIIERNLKWLDCLNLKHLLYANIEKM